MLRKAGYGVLIFDWKGDDYAPYYEDKTIKLKEIGRGAEGEISIDEAVSTLLEGTCYFGASSDSSTAKTCERSLKGALEGSI